MVKKTKTGKQRLDRYYHLAKEQGYRSRSAFKLIQLAQKFNIFNNCRSVIDLCAAPGGWLQVAQKMLPISSQIIGVDLVSIRAIKNVQLIQADITTSVCRNKLKSIIDDNSEVDVVLNDGSPNMGTHWSVDAYQQNELVVYATQLACEFLRPGGIFVTKVFRSTHYHSLLWMLQQLFNRVQATKPQSSRNESAEIFVVCMDYKYPDQIDPKLFQPKYLFLSVQDTHTDNTNTHNNKGISSLLSMAGKRHRSGYDLGDDYRELLASEFINTHTPAETLLKHNKIVFTHTHQSRDTITHNDLYLKNHILTTPEMCTLFDDLRVLGKADLHKILKWRFRILQEKQRNEKSSVHTLDENHDNVNTTHTDITHTSKKQSIDAHTHIPNEEQTDTHTDNTHTHIDSEEEEKNIHIELDKIKDELKKIEKQKLREKRKLTKKLGLHTHIENSTNVDDYDDELYRLTKESVRALKIEKNVINFDEKYQHEQETGYYTHRELDIQNIENAYTHTQKLAQEYDKENYIHTLENEFEEAYLSKQHKLELTGKNKKYTRRELVLQERAQEMKEFTDNQQRIVQQTRYQSESEDDSENDEMFEIGQNVEIEDEEVENENAQVLDESTQRWFSNDLFKLTETPHNEDEEQSDFEENGTNNEFPDELKDSELAFIPLSIKQARKLKNKEKTAKQATKNSSADDEDNLNNKHTFIEVPQDTHTHTHTQITKPKSKDEIAEIQALGSLMVHKNSRMDLLDGAYNRYAFDDDTLPIWFKEDEKRHNKPELPITKELMKSYRQKMKEINSRPIRKVLEATGRKRKRFEQKLAKVRQKANKIAENDDIGESKKSKTIQSMISKARRESKREKTYIVSKRPGGGKFSQTSSKKISKNSKFTAVDRRLKNDKRKQKLSEMKKKKIKFPKSKKAGSYRHKR